MNSKDDQLLFESYQLILERECWVNALLNNGFSQKEIDQILDSVKAGKSVVDTVKEVSLLI